MDTCLTYDNDEFVCVRALLADLPDGGANLLIAPRNRTKDIDAVTCANCLTEISRSQGYAPYDAELVERKHREREGRA